MSLNFKSGKPLAFVKGGKYNGKIIYLGNEKEVIKDPYEYIEEDEIRKHKKKMGPLELARVKREFLVNEEYSDIKKKVEGIEGKEIAIHDDGIVFPVPNVDGSERMYICGPTGSGKSTQIGNYISHFKKIFPDAQIYVISDQSTDEVLDVHKPIRIELTEELFENPIEMEEFPKGSLVIFDDIDSISNKKIMQAVGALRDTLLKRGRHQNLYTIVTSHQCTNYKETRIILNEVSSVTVFPRSGATNGIKRLLSVYCGLNKDQIDRVFNLPSRWVRINKSYPMSVIYEKGIYLL